MSEIPGYVKMTAGAIREKAYQKWQKKKNEYDEWRKVAIEFLLNWKKTKSKFYCLWHDVPKDNDKLLQWKMSLTFFMNRIEIEGFPESPSYGLCARDWYYRTKNLSDSTEVFINVDDVRLIFG